MHKRGAFVLFILVLAVVTAIAVWLRQRQFGATASEPQSSLRASLAAAAAREPQARANSGRDIAGTELANDNLKVDSEFQNWLSREAKELDRTNIDGDTKQAELRKVVAKITPVQARQLSLTARNPRAPAAEKILSTFLLVEAGSKAHQDLVELITSPLAEKGPFLPHSEEESKGVREKSLRIMGIDGLFSQAQTDPRARDLLARSIPSIDDPTIRAYAEDKLRQLH